ncbi:Chromosome undetermined scaffold_139, whole genome shotgun sequence (plasmid) [Mesorhizobium loti]|nr:Chromosome undetermined scaffold_139, whole genome shotgun sequence [Mesorhizobium loti]
MLVLRESQSLDPAPPHLPDATEFRWAFLRNKTEAAPNADSSLRKLERQLALRLGNCQFCSGPSQKCMN